MAGRGDFVIKNGVLNEYKGKDSEVVIPEGVTEIGDWAFERCRSLSSITIPESVTEIGRDAFYYCSNLKSITIPEGVREIGRDAFRYCSSLTSITIPESVREIGEDAFYGCSSLTSILVDINNKKYDSRDNCNAIIETKNNKLVIGCKTTIIPKL